MESKDYDFRYNCGVFQPVSSIVESSDRNIIVNCLCKHYSIAQVKAELDQLVEGLEMFKFQELVNSAPNLIRQLFVHFKPLKLTSEDIFNMFPPEFTASTGSNMRELEEAALINWIRFTQEVECE